MRTGLLYPLWPGIEPICSSANSFTDFIINYDIKYRTGRGGDEENGK